MAKSPIRRCVNRVALQKAGSEEYRLDFLPGAANSDSPIKNVIIVDNLLKTKYYSEQRIKIVFLFLKEKWKNKN